MLAAAGAMALLVSALLLPWSGFSWRTLPWIAVVELGWLAGMRIFAAGLQAQAVERHVARGGRLEPVWTGLVVGAFFLAGISAFTLGTKTAYGKIASGRPKMEARRRGETATR